MYRSSIGSESVKCRSNFGQVSVKCRSSVGQVSVKCRSSVGQVSVMYRSSIGHVSVKYRSSIGQVSVKYRSSIGHVSVRYWSADVSADMSTESTYSTHDPRCLRFVTNCLWKIFYITSSASDQSPLFSRRNRSLYLLCSPLKLSQETRCNILMYLSVFNFRSLCERCYEAKLKLVVSYSDSFD